MALGFFADHCVSRFVIEALRNDGHRVERLGDHLPIDAAKFIAFVFVDEVVGAEVIDRRIEIEDGALRC